MSKVKIRTYKVKGMDCSSCAMAVESDLEDIGIIAKCSYVKEELEIESNPNEVKEEKIREIVKNLGFNLS